MRRFPPPRPRSLRGLENFFPRRTRFMISLRSRLLLTLAQRAFAARRRCSLNSMRQLIALDVHVRQPLAPASAATYPSTATLAEKGFPREPLKVIEICNAKYASRVLDKDVKIALMLPCPICVYVEGGKTHISTLLPSSIADFFPQAGIEGLASEVEKIVLKIVEEASNIRRTA